MRVLTFTSSFESAHGRHSFSQRSYPVTSRFQIVDTATPIVNGKQWLNFISWTALSRNNRYTSSPRDHRGIANQKYEILSQSNPTQRQHRSSSSVPSQQT